MSSEPSANKHRRGPGRPFPKGVSGNPGGQSKLARDVQALAREYTVQAIATLVDALSDERLRVSAAVHLLDRGWGKPHEHLQLDGTSRVTSVSLHIVAVGDEAATIDSTPNVITITRGSE